MATGEAYIQMLKAKHQRLRDRTERGAALVEFALILPILMSLVLGVITGGVSYNRKISMTNAVREASRFGATLDESATWGSSVVARVRDLAGGDLQTSQICAELVRAPSTPIQSEPATCPFGGKPPDPAESSGTCIVKVWTQRSSDLEAFFFSRTLTLTASAVNRYERLCP